MTGRRYIAENGTEITDELVDSGPRRPRTVSPAPRSPRSRGARGRPTPSLCARAPSV